MIDQKVIDTIRERTDIVALINESVRLVRKGNTWRGCCPFHKEKTPSFHVNPTRGQAHCFGCKKSVDAIGFVTENDGLTFVEAVTMLAERLGIDVEETRTPQEKQEANAAKRKREDVFRANELAATFFETCLWAAPIPAGIPQECHFECATRVRYPGATNAWEELGRRGLAPTTGNELQIGKTIRAFRIGFAPAHWDTLLRYLVAAGISPLVAAEAGLVKPRQGSSGYYDVFRNRLMFAVTDVQGRVVGFSGRALSLPPGGDAEACKEPAKYVNTPESPIYTKGNNLFGLWQAKNAVRRGDEAVLVEGNFDVVSLHARGLDNIVAPLGTAFTAEQAALLKRFGTHVTLAFDGDAAGKKATAASREACANAALSARVASLPQGSDPDALVRELGADGLRRMLDGAAGLVEWLIDEALDPSTFRRAPLQEQLERVRAVGDLLAKENDGEMRGLALMYANRAAVKLGLTSSSSITIAQLGSILTGKLRGGGGRGGGGVPAVEPVAHGPEWTLQEAILGALIDEPEMLTDETSWQGADQAFDGEFALAFGALVRYGATSEALGEIPPSIHDFVAARMVEPLHGREDIPEIIRANVAKLSAMHKLVSRDDLLKELDAAIASGNDNETMRVMAKLDAMERR